MTVNPTRRQVRQLRRDNSIWPPRLEAIPADKWPKHIPHAKPRVNVFRSREFLVQVFDEGHDTLRLSVNRTDWDFTLGRWREDISWDDLQRLKEEAGYGGRWAVEIFPAADEVVNEANMRHIWLLKGAPTFAWRKGTA